MEYVCHDFLTTVTSLRIWGEKKKTVLLIEKLSISRPKYFNCVASYSGSSWL